MSKQLNAHLLPHNSPLYCHQNRVPTSEYRKLYSDEYRIQYLATTHMPKPIRMV